MTRLRTLALLFILASLGPLVLLAGLVVGGDGERATANPPAPSSPLPADPYLTLPTLERASRSTSRPAVSQPAARAKDSDPDGVPAGRSQHPVRARHLAARAGGRDAMWDALVACEAPDRGWRYGAPGVGIDAGYPEEGGPNFEPSTWTAYRLAGYPLHAYDATRDQQVAVAERVLADQGPGAWPVCAPRVGLTRENGLN